MTDEQGRPNPSMRAEPGRSRDLLHAVQKPGNLIVGQKLLSYTKPKSQYRYQNLEGTDDPMKVFISWSGDKSLIIAQALREWLPTIIQSLEPFMSAQDISAGERGLNVLAGELQYCSFGILCLTQDNKERPWINFEAGALSKVIDTSKVVPLLLDLRPNDLTGPLAQFQAISASNKNEVFKLVHSIAEDAEPPRIAEHILTRTFDAFWPEFEAKVTEAQTAGTVSPVGEIRSERDVLEEILTLSRRVDKELTRLAPRPLEFDDNYLKPEYGPDVVIRSMIENLRTRGIDEVKTYAIGNLAHFHVTAPEAESEYLRDLFKHAAAIAGIAIRVQGQPIHEELFDGRRPKT